VGVPFGEGRLAIFLKTVLMAIFAMPRHFVKSYGDNLIFASGTYPGIDFRLPALE